MTEHNSPSSLPEPGAHKSAPKTTHRGFREFGYVVAAIAAALAVISIVKPFSASKPAVVAVAPTPVAPAKSAAAPAVVAKSHAAASTPSEYNSRASVADLPNFEFCPALGV